MSATAFQRMRHQAEAKDSQKQVEKVENNEVADQIDEQQAADEVDADTSTNLDDMSVEELIQYANEHGIDIGSASSQKGILKKVKEAE